MAEPVYLHGGQDMTAASLNRKEEISESTGSLSEPVDNVVEIFNQGTLQLQMYEVYHRVQHSLPYIYKY